MTHKEDHVTVWGFLAAMATISAIIGFFIYFWYPINNTTQDSEYDVEQSAEGLAIYWNAEASQWIEKVLHDGRDQGPLSCKLVPCRKRNHYDPDLRCDLTNTSEKPVRLWSSSGPPHWKVTFLIRDRNGTVLQEGYWGSLSSSAIGVRNDGTIANRLFVQKLTTGKRYSAGIDLSWVQQFCEVQLDPDHRRAELAPGRYHLEAAFAYADLGGWPEPNQRYLARSQKLLIEVFAKAPGAKRAKWELVGR